jgi:hypothetical protein
MPLDYEIKSRTSQAPLAKTGSRGSQNFGKGVSGSMNSAHLDIQPELRTSIDWTLQLDMVQIPVLMRTVAGARSVCKMMPVSHQLRKLICYPALQCGVHWDDFSTTLFEMQIF